MFLTWMRWIEKKQTFALSFCFKIFRTGDFHLYLVFMWTFNIIIEIVDFLIMFFDIDERNHIEFTMILCQMY